MIYYCHNKSQKLEFSVYSCTKILPCWKFKIKYQYIFYLLILKTEFMTFRHISKFFLLKTFLLLSINAWNLWVYHVLENIFFFLFSYPSNHFLRKECQNGYFQLIFVCDCQEKMLERQQSVEIQVLLWERIIKHKEKHKVLNIWYIFNSLVISQNFIHFCLRLSRNVSESFALISRKVISWEQLF